MHSSSVRYGADVSKAEIVIAAYGERALLTIDNSRKAISAWLKQLPAGCLIGMEATGVHHRLLADLAFAAGHTVFVLNPRSISRYLNSLRARGKTDAIDARGIARFVAHETDDEHPYVPPTTEHRAVQTLLQRRHHVVKSRAALQMSFSDVENLAGAALKTLMSAYAELIRQIDARLRALVRTDAQLQSLCERLRTIPGVGALISTSLGLRLHRHRYANSDAVVAALGFDPRPCESGNFIGRRRLSKQGNGEERRLLYMAAVSACRNPLWRRRFEQLCAAGHPTTAAHCIIARKLLRIAFALCRNNSTYDEKAIAGACTQT